MDLCHICLWYHSGSYFSLAHEAKVVLGAIQPPMHNAASDALLSMQLYLKFIEVSLWETAVDIHERHVTSALLVDALSDCADIMAYSLTHSLTHSCKAIRACLTLCARLSLPSPSTRRSTRRTPTSRACAWATGYVCMYVCMVCSCIICCSVDT